MRIFSLFIVADSVGKWIRHLGGLVLDPAGPRRQHPSYLGPGGQLGRIPHRTFGTPIRMVGLLRFHGDSRRRGRGLYSIRRGK